MEEKKIDPNSIIGFVLIFGILIFMFYQNQPTPEEIEAEKVKQEQVDVEKANEVEQITNTPINEKAEINLQDSTAVASYKNSIGSFSFTKASDGITSLENELVSLKISNKGGQIVEAKMTNFVTYDSVPVYLIKDGNAAFGMEFTTSDNRKLNTEDLYFEPALSKNGDNQVLSMKAKVGPSKFLEYRYEMKPDDYLVDFAVRSQGLNGVINSSNDIQLNWRLKGLRHSKSVEYENRYTEIMRNFEDGKIDYMSTRGDDEETDEDVQWISFKQHFFTSILATKKNFKLVDLTSKDLVEEESKAVAFTKEFEASIPLTMEGGEISENLNWYYGPTDVEVLSKYEEYGLDDTIYFGWGIFGWINRYVFTPFYSFLSGFLPYGIAIVIMTILVRLAMSPVTYKSYLSQAKMKVLKPEIS